MFSEGVMKTCVTDFYVTDCRFPICIFRISFSVLLWIALYIRHFMCCFAFPDFCFGFVCFRVLCSDLFSRVVSSDSYFSDLYFFVLSFSICLFRGSSFRLKQLCLFSAKKLRKRARTSSHIG